MFNSLTGEIAEKAANMVYLTMNGVEWEIWTTSQSIGRLPEAGQAARIFTYLHHREDQIRLFGFAEKPERDLFLKLIKVDNVGPALALKILSGISTDAFVAAVETEDLDTLVSVPGLGNKTAQKIVLQLKGRLISPQTDDKPAHKDIVAALTGMGFDRRDAGRAVKKALESLQRESKSDSKEDFERELLKRSIRLVSQKT